MAAHSKLGASSSDKWLNCAGALALEKTSGADKETKSYTLEGTVAHALAEKCLRTETDASLFVGELIPFTEDDPFGMPVTIHTRVSEGMASAVDVYLNYVRNLGGAPFIEEKVDYSSYVPEGFGTTDFATEVMEDVNVLYVVDYKHGEGIKVDAFENTQGMLYALGAILSLDMFFKKPIEKIVIVICQPRMNNISEWSITPAELFKWAKNEAAPKGDLAHSLLENPALVKDGHFKPTKKGCQWCKAKKVCKAFVNKGYDAAITGFSDLSREAKSDLVSVDVNKGAFKNIHALNNEELAKCYSDMALFVSWYSSLKDEILDKLLAGEKVPGYKPVNGNGSRAWVTDENGDVIEDRIIAAIRTAGLKKKDYLIETLVSPAKAEAALKKEKPKDHKKRYEKLATSVIRKKPGAPTIAKETDKRDSIAPEADEFLDLTSTKPEVDDGF